MQAMMTDAAQSSTREQAKPTSLNWLGLTLFALLMIYPFVVNFIPPEIRALLSTSFR
jgi:hypothetical protein